MIGHDAGNRAWRRTRATCRQGNAPIGPDDKEGRAMEFDTVTRAIAALAALIRVAGSLADWVRTRRKEKRAKHRKPTR